MQQVLHVLPLLCLLLPPAVAQEQPDLEGQPWPAKWITLPPGLEGILNWKGQMQTLKSGSQSIKLR